jgi:hypothetical protein
VDYRFQGNDKEPKRSKKKKARNRLFPKPAPQIGSTPQRLRGSGFHPVQPAISADVQFTPQ